MARDLILIESLEFIGHHGWFEPERRRGCRFRVDLEMVTDVRASARSDRLSETIDYSAVAEELLKVGTTSSFLLIERLAERLCRAVLTRFPVAEVTLTLRKLDPPVAGGPVSVGVKMSRTRADFEGEAL